MCDILFPLIPIFKVKKTNHLYKNVLDSMTFVKIKTKKKLDHYNFWMLDTQVVFLWKFPRVHNIWDWSTQKGLRSIIYIHYGYWKTRTFAKFWSNRFPFHRTCHWNYLNISAGFCCDKSSFIKIVRHKFSVIWIFHLLLKVSTTICITQSFAILNILTTHGIDILIYTIFILVSIMVYSYVKCQYIIIFAVKSS